MFIICLLQTFAHEASMQAHLPAGWYPQQKDKLHAKLLELEQKAEKTYEASLNNCSVPVWGRARCPGCRLRLRRDG